MALDISQLCGIMEAMNAAEIRELRQRLGLTQAAFARRLGLHMRTVEEWESGRHAPRGLSLRALLRLQREAARLAERAERGSP